MRPDRGRKPDRRSRATNTSMRKRRGAIAVMTGIFIVAIMLVAAVSVDASRIFVAKNELQTAADAAALAGALQLLKDSTTAEDTARAYARRNRVEANFIDSSDVEIEPGQWRPSERTFIAGADPRDAVRVTMRVALPLSLARVFGDSTVTITSSAIAWSSAPIAESSCSKPLAVPYGRLLNVLGLNPTSDIDLTDADIRQLREMPVAYRYATLPYASSEDTTGYFSFDDDEYFPVDIDSTWVRGDPLSHSRDEVSSNSFMSYVVGPPAGRCARSVRPGDEVRSEPGNKRSSIREGIGDLCQLNGGTFTMSECRRDDEHVDIPFKVVFWHEEPSWENPNRALLRVKMVGSFVFSELRDTDEAGAPAEATLFGYFDVRQDFGVVDDAAPSTLIRPVLVK